MDSIAELIHYDCVYLWENVEGRKGGGGLGHIIKYNKNIHVDYVSGQH